MRKIGRHVSPAMLAEMMNPATMGPARAAPAMTGPNTANTVGICSRERLATMMLRPWGMSMAPNPPCTSRKAISMVGSTERPQPREARVKPAMPMRNTRRCP